MDLVALAKAQTKMNDLSIYKEYFLDKNDKIICEASQTNPRPVVPISHRRSFFCFL